MQPLVLPVSDFSWLRPWVLKPGWMHHPLRFLSLVLMNFSSQLWFPKSRPGPNFTPWYGEATTRVTAQCHFWDCWQIWTQDLMTQSLMLYRLSYPGQCEKNLYSIRYGSECLKFSAIWPQDTKCLSVMYTLEIWWKFSSIGVVYQKQIPMLWIMSYTHQLKISWLAIGKNGHGEIP